MANISEILSDSIRSKVIQNKDEKAEGYDYYVYSYHYGRYGSDAYITKHPEMRRHFECKAKTFEDAADYVRWLYNLDFTCEKDDSKAKDEEYYFIEKKQ